MHKIETLLPQTHSHTHMHTHIRTHTALVVFLIRWPCLSYFCSFILMNNNKFIYDENILNILIYKLLKFHLLHTRLIYAFKQVEHFHFTTLFRKFFFSFLLFVVLLLPNGWIPFKIRETAKCISLQSFPSRWDGHNNK